MDLQELAQWIVTLLAPVLPHLLQSGKAVAGRVLDQAEAALAEAIWKQITGSAGTDEVQEAAGKLADRTTEGRSTEGWQVVLAEELEAALKANHEMTQIIRELIDSAGVTIHAGGDFIVGDKHIRGDQVYGDKVHGDYYTIDTVVVPPLPPKDNTLPSLLNSYLHWVAYRAGELPLADVLDLADGETREQLRLGGVYIDLDVFVPEKMEDERVWPDLKERHDKPHRFSAVSAASQSQHLVLTGNPGAGKSTFAKFLALCLAGEYLGDRQMNLARLGEEWPHGSPWPVFVELRHFAARGTHSLWEFIRDELPPALAGFAEYLEQELRDPGGLILLDGLDEVPEAEANRKRVLASVQEFRTLFPACRIIVTSRTYAYYQQDWRLPDFDDAALAHFSREQQEAFIDKWFAGLHQIKPSLTRDEALARGVMLKDEIAARPHDLGWLAERPLLLTLMAALRANRPDRLPPSRAEIYRQIAEVLLRRWEQLRIVRDARGEIKLRPHSLSAMLKTEYDQVRCALEQVSFEVHEAAGMEQDTADIRVGHLAEVLLAVSPRSDLALSKVIDYVENRAGLLEAHGEGVYRFPHRTFQEFMAAAYLCREASFPDVLVEKISEDPELWREVALLAAGQQDHAGVFLLVDELVLDVPDRWPDPDDAVWWRPWLAGQILIETDNTHPAQERNRRPVRRVQEWLVGLVKQGALPPVDRAQAGRTLATLDDTRKGVGLRDDKLPDIDWVEIPGEDEQGKLLKFIYGDDEFEYAAPRETRTEPTFYIARYPVTWAQYQAFVDAKDGYQQAEWWDYSEEAEAWRKENTQPINARWPLANHPREEVAWYEAIAFCRWLTVQAQGHSDLLPDGVKLEAGWQITLPTEWQWEKAASWDAEKERKFNYPYGDESDAAKGNTGETGISQTSAVGIFPQGAAPCGALDMSGNVWEWCLNEYSNPENTSLGGDEWRVVRGGSWSGTRGYAGAACRHAAYPYGRSLSGGFRVVCGRPPSR